MSWMRVEPVLSDPDLVADCAAAGVDTAGLFVESENVAEVLPEWHMPWAVKMFFSVGIPPRIFTEVLPCFIDDTGGLWVDFDDFFSRY